MNAEELANILAEHSLFADCDEAELADLILRGHFVQYKKGDELIMQGDPGNSLLILLSGNARTSMIASNGNEVVLDYAEAGQVLGEIALLDGGERTASVTAIEPTSALFAQALRGGRGRRATETGPEPERTRQFRRDVA